MIELLFSPALPWGLAAGGVLASALAGRSRQRSALWALVAGLCAVSGVLCTLLQGGELEATLPNLLLIAAAALAGPGRRRGGGDG